MTTTWAVLVLLFFAAASFFFALAESALFSLGQWQLRQLKDKSPAGAGIVQLLTAPQDLLATIVLGNTVANACMVAVTLWVAVHEAWPMLPTLAVLLLLILFVAEVAPKTLAVRAPEFWSLRLVGPMQGIIAVCRPLHRLAQKTNDVLILSFLTRTIKPLNHATDAEYQELIELAYQQGTLAATEREIILQIISLDRRTARDVMRPRARMACIPDDLSPEEMIAAAREHKHTRLPMYDENPDTIVGVLNTRTFLLNPDGDMLDAIEFPSFVPESMNLLQLFKSLQRQQRGLAIVLNEFGGTAGIVSMEDILEEIVGELRHEGAQRGFVFEKLGTGRWRVNGTMRIDDFLRECPDLGAITDVDTMGGLLARELSVIPAAGDTAVCRGLKLTASVVDERRVKELLVEAVKKR